ncbi:MAG: hypothetical protein LBU14_02545 [Candidatus Peribacteria bacterium]|nr:hypothetical protein [Candidatus Peribacteria bacterium]
MPQTIPEKEEVIEVNYEEELEIQQAKQIEILNNASEEGNLEACDSITSERLKSQCVDNANLSLASKENDKTYCEKVQDSFWRNNCISSFQS